MAEDGNRQAFIRELRLLRGGSGLRAGRVTRCNALLQALDYTPEELHQRIVAELRAMQKNRDTRALINAYGIGHHDPGILTDRRSNFGVDNGERGPETVETWENAAIEELLTRLLREHNSSKPLDVYELHVTYYLDALLDPKLRVIQVLTTAGWVDELKRTQSLGLGVGVGNPDYYVGNAVYYEVELPAGATDTPTKLDLSVFISTPHPIERAYGVSAASLNDAMVAHRFRIEPAVVGDNEAQMVQADFDSPLPGRVCGLLWE